MDKNIKNILNGVVGVAMVSLMSSCAAETPWEDEGTGTVYLHTAINHITTRAIDGYTDEDLKDRCVIYISRKNGILQGDSKTKDGLVYKKKGLSNLDSKITLGAGKYAAEAWTGDSVPASFDKKYFRAYREFTVDKGGVSTVDLTCKIQNTIVMIDNTDIDKLPMKDYTVTVSSSAGGELEFKKSDNSIINKGYFMMPEDGKGNLSYTISGTKTSDNTTFTYTGKIENVKRTWAYKLKFGYNPTEVEKPGGASFIDIEVDETGVDAGNDAITIPSAAPAIEGVGFTLAVPEGNATTLDYTVIATIPSEIGFKVCAVGDIKTLTISVDSDASQTYDLLTIGGAPIGITLVSPKHDDATNVTTAYILISKNFIEGLTTGQTHSFTITASDANGKESTALLKITR